MGHDEVRTPTDPTTVLHVLGTLDRGGTEKRALDLMRAIDRSRFQLEFCVLSGQTGALDNQVRSLGGQVHYCPLGRRFASKFTQLLNDRRVDVVHSHIHNASGLILRLAARSKVSIRIAHFRTTHSGRLPTLRRNAQDRLMRRWILKYATHVLGVSEATLSLNWGDRWKSDYRFAVVRNGIDLGQTCGAGKRTSRSTLGLPAEALVCLNVGSFQPDKNHAQLVEVFARLRGVRPDAMLVLVGGRGSEQDRIEQAIIRKGLSGAVLMTGERDDVPAWLNAADVFIFPSRREGSPGAILEAVAAGLPVIASDIPPIVEISRIAPGVQTISRDAGHRVWTEAILAAVERTGRPDPRAYERFRQCFDVETTAQTHQIIWSGGMPARSC